MIQPVSAFSPRSGFRGSSRSFGKASCRISDVQAAMLASAGVSTAAGALTTTIARGYTSSWAGAGAIGLFGALLAMFLLTPQMIFGQKGTQKD